MGKLSIANLIILRRWLVLVTASMGLYLVLPDRGLANDEDIKPNVPNGTYSFRDSGYLVSPGSTTPTVLIAAAGRITFFANGTTSGVLTASLNGNISAITIKGTRTVDPKDGSILETEQQFGGPGATLHFKDYPTLDGNTITFVASDPGAIVSGIDTR